MQTDNRCRLRILASGKGWLAVDKPAGMTVHNDPGKDLCTRLSILLQAQPGLRAETGLTASHRLHAAHRLDRETSGVILLAGERSALSHFAAQFKARTVEKYYAAILHGLLPARRQPDTWYSWQWSLARTPGGRRDPRGQGPRQACTTLVRVLDSSPHHTLVECRPLTGRKHQIRRHAKLAGHPVVGDCRYGSKRSLEFVRHAYAFKHLALHATRLEIEAPDGTPLCLRSPELPGAMRDILSRDRSASAANRPLPQQSKQ